MKQSNAEESYIVARARQDLTASLVYLSTMNKLFYADTDRAMTSALSILRDREVSEAYYHELAFQFRALTRAFFAQVEGTSYVMRILVVWTYDRSEIELSSEELYKLSEGERGESKSGRRYNSLKENVELSLHYFGRLLDSDYRLDKSKPGWRDFLGAIDARDAITHPKDVKSFLFSPQSMIAVRQAIVWFNGSMSFLLSSSRVSSGRRNRD